MTTTDYDRPLGKQEIAERLGVSEQTVKKWRQRGQFPEPEMTVNGLAAWWESTILGWAEETGRLPE